MKAPASHVRPITLDQALPIRQCVLWPDKPLAFCAVADDAQGQHVGAFVDGALVGVASLFNDGAGQVRLRKFAVLPAAQRNGAGSAIMRHALAAAAASGAHHFWCDARLEAVAFYQRFGLQIESAEQVREGRRFVRMGVALAGPPA